MNVEKLIALLPMKGHSERVPNKNMKMFCGEPLYHAVMKSLEACDYVSEIVIDTDSDIIAEDAVRNFRKVRILRRPQELQGDFVSMNEIINYDLTRHPEEKHFLQTHSTNPLISSATLNAAIQRYFAALGEGYDSLFGVTKFQSRFYWANGSAINHNPAELIRTQDLPPKTPISTFSRSIRFVPQETKESDCIPKCSQSTSWRPSTSTTKKILF